MGLANAGSVIAAQGGVRLEYLKRLYGSQTL